jgi:ribonuclease HI
VDGFVLDRNPSPRGGGFTVVREHDNQLIVNHFIMRVGFTNNDGELLAIAYAAHKAEPGDTIVTDAQCMTYWCKSGACGARPDLTPIAAKVKRWMKDKNLTLVWKRRNDNLAGLFNETMTRP